MRKRRRRRRKRKKEKEDKDEEEKKRRRRGRGRGGGGELNYHNQLMGNYFLCNEYSLDSEQMQPFCNIGK